jgi:hypothetical protein
VAGRAYRDLQKLAKAQDLASEKFFELFALEGFLRRMAASQYRSDFVLKGGVLMAAFQLRRPTRDIDFHATEVRNEEDAILSAAKAIARIQIEDGLEYLEESARATTIRDGDEYSGVRVLMTARLATARLHFNIDFNVGDPIWPGPRPIELPLLLGGTLALKGYPVEMVLAEKVVTALQRRTANTRMRDFADLYLLIGTQELEAERVRSAIQIVADHRGEPVAALSEVLDGFGELQQERWRAWTREQSMEDRLPAELAEVVTRICEFADPILRSR